MGNIQSFKICRKPSSPNNVSNPKPLEVQAKRSQTKPPNVFQQQPNAFQQPSSSFQSAHEEEYLPDSEVKAKVTKQIIDTLSLPKQKSADQKLSVWKKIEIGSDAKTTVHVLGDLEGNIQLLYNFLFDNKLIKYDEENGFVWQAPPNVYVVQLGDQVDRNIHPRYDTDLAVPVFCEFLSSISDNHFISILGNHEHMNMTSDFHDVSGDDMLFDSSVSTDNAQVKPLIDVLMSKGGPLYDEIIDFLYEEIPAQSGLHTHIFKKYEDIYNLQPFEKTNIQHAHDYYCVLVNIALQCGLESDQDLMYAFKSYEKFILDNANRKKFLTGFLEHMARRPVFVEMGHCIFSHAGITDEMNNTLKEKSLTTDKVFNDSDVHDAVWNRDFNNLVGSSIFELVKLLTDNKISIMGHNTQPDKAIVYCGGECTQLKSKPISITKGAASGTSELVYTDVNRGYSPTGLEDENTAYHFLTITAMKTGDNVEYNIQAETRSITTSKDPCILHIGLFEGIFKNEIIPKLLRPPNDKPQTAGKNRKYVKTTERVVIKNRRYVVYMYKKTKFVKWNKEYRTLKSVKKSIDNLEAKNNPKKQNQLLIM